MGVESGVISDIRYRGHDACVSEGTGALARATPAKSGVCAELYDLLA